jgi:hypothetical protein
VYGKKGGGEEAEMEEEEKREGGRSDHAVTVQSSIEFLL